MENEDTDQLCPNVKADHDITPYVSRKTSLRFGSYFEIRDNIWHRSYLQPQFNRNAQIKGQTIKTKNSFSIQARQK